MAIDVVQIFEKNQIDYKTGGAQVTKGWINIQCPFCGDSGYHLGYNPMLDLFTCWRCGVKNKQRVMTRLLNMSKGKVEDLLDEFYVVGSKKENPIQLAQSCVLPKNERGLLPSHQQYLIGRGFNPDELERDWLLTSCGNYGEYRNRIIIPIYYQRQLVSFHSRSVLQEAELKAKACQQEKEVVRHKEVLYGMDKVPGNTVIVSEAPFDKWRWGNEGVATFGIKWTERQVELLSCFKNIILVYDSKVIDGIEHEKTAAKQAEELSDRLALWNKVWLVTELGCDPAELSQRRANRIKRGFLEMVEKK